MPLAKKTMSYKAIPQGRHTIKLGLDSLLEKPREGRQYLLLVIRYHLLENEGK